MAEQDDDLLRKADALMQRRSRVFVAGANDLPPKEEAAADAGDDDLPLLTEIVSPDELPEIVDVAALRRALAAEVEAWLDRDLPAHVQRVLDGITDQLIIQLSQKARAELLPKLQQIIAASSAGAKPVRADD